MTYCLGMLLKDGLVMIADTRTNAGVDNISSYRKLHILEQSSERTIVACTAGNLSVTQAAFAMLREGLEEDEDSDGPRFVSDMPNMHRVAGLVGEALQLAREEIVEGAGEDTQYSFTASMLLGGRIADRPLRLFHIYKEGNFISCQPDRPFMQIGETKYGKPILDRALQYDTPLDDAVKTGLVSFDSTMRSNLSVGRPLDVMVMPTDPDAPVITRRIDETDEYFNMLSSKWATALAEARAAIPMPPFMSERETVEAES
ncbi:peptidase [uncultured Parasphingopyxis sp.]|uniref:peptidase n=1 Tax=uncultured Parasphingopyxis sp. TaxID=1547918 RepID=UPI002626BBF1|nr:peptidase [uncultured Parasphingopyxis sp.]